jgi:hypothetical protein
VLPQQKIFALNCSTGVLIRARLPHEEEIIRLLRPGDNYHGKTFDEWVDVAQGSGVLCVEEAQAS